MSTSSVLFLVVAVVGLVAFLFTRSAPVAKVKQALDNGALVVDVRTAGEFKEGHFPGALNVPVDQIEARMGELGDKKEPIVLYCHSGMRSGSAIHILKKAGFTRLINAGTLHRVTEAGKE